MVGKSKRFRYVTAKDFPLGSDDRLQTTYRHELFAKIRLQGYCYRLSHRRMFKEGPPRSLVVR